MITLGVIVSHDCRQFRRLIDWGVQFVDEVVVCADIPCEDGIVGYREGEKVSYFNRALNKDFAAQRNAVIEKATQDWVLFLDSDENFEPWMWINLRNVIASAGEAELIMLPRANYIEGVSKNCTDFVNWPDSQPKLHRRHVRWWRAVHELPVGYPTGMRVHWLPNELPYAIMHTKTVEQWNKASQFYSTITA